MQRAIVSGASGHLGRELIAQLMGAGIEVHGLTRKAIPPNCLGARSSRLHRIDGTTETLAAILKGVQPDTVFHLAAVSRREHQRCDVEPFIEANVLFGTQLLEAMRSTECRRFVTAGSYLQHFDTDGYRALNLYAATKQAFEAILAYYVDAFGFSAVRITLCDVYSENDTRPKLMTAIATACKDRTPLTLQDSKASVDLVHVEDAAAAFLQAACLLERNTIPNQMLSRYSVSSGYSVSATELVVRFEQLGKRDITIKHKEERGAWRRMTPWRGQTLPGWEPRVTLEAGIARILRTIGIC